MHEKISLKII